MKSLWRKASEFVTALWALIAIRWVVPLPPLPHDPYPEREVPPADAMALAYAELAAGYAALARRSERRAGVLLGLAAGLTVINILTMTQ